MPNNLPGFISMQLDQAVEGQQYTYRLWVSDLDVDDPLTVDIVSGNPGWLEIQNLGDRTAELRCVAAGCGSAGTYNIVLNVSDGKLIASQMFDLVVKPAAIPPVFDSQPITTAFVGQQYSYTVRVSNPGGGAVVLKAIDIPPWFQLTVDNVLISTRNPDITDIGGVYTILLEVTDAQGFTARQPFSITVADYRN